MAEGKNIEIRIAATGGDQAAAEIRKVESAEEGLSSATNKTALDLPAITAGSGRASNGLNQLAQTAGRVTAASVSMRSNIQNVGYQVQDFAVQVGAGTSAMRAFSQQAPQLLSAFGPWGVALGTAVAIGGPLVSMLTTAAFAADNLAEAQKDAADSTDEATRKNDAAREATRELKAAEEERIATLEKTREQIAEITGEQNNYNEALRAEISLMKERHQGDKELADAKTAHELEAANGDPAKQEEIRNRARKETREREISQIREEQAKKNELMKGIDADDVRAQTEAANKRSEIESRKKQAEQESREKSTWADQQEELQKGEESLAGNDKLSPMERGRAARNADKFKSQAAKLRREADDAKKRSEDASKAKTELDEAARREQESRDKERNSIFQDIQGGDRKIDRLEQKGKIEDSTGELKRQRLKEEQQKKADDKKAQEERKAEAEEKRKQAAADRREREEAGIGRDAKDLLPKKGGVTERVRRAVDLASQNLQDGDQGGEMDLILKFLDAMAAKNGKRDKARDAKIAQLEARIKNL